MVTFILRRLLQAMPVLWGVITVTFLLTYLVPGDPARLILGSRANETNIEDLRQRMGLDDPLYVQYTRYLWNVVRGDLGESFVYHRPVIQIIGEKLPATTILALTAIVMATAAGILLGVIAGIYQNRGFDHGSMLIAMLGICLPSFFLAIMVQWVFGFLLYETLDGFFPTAGYMDEHGVVALVLPSLTLAFLPLATFARLTRSSYLEVKEHDYVRTARAKGLAENVVIFKHILKNALNPVVTAVSGTLAAILAGTFFIEYVFNWPGVGYTAIRAIEARDFPLIQGTVLLTAVIFIVVNIISDIAYALLDPRISLS